MKPIILPIAHAHGSVCALESSRSRVLGLCICLSVYCHHSYSYVYLVCMPKVRHHRAPYRILKICVVWILLKTFYSGDLVLLNFACHDDQQLGSLLMRNTPTIYYTTTNNTVYEPLARSDN